MINYRTTKDQQVNGYGGPEIISYAGKCVCCGRKVYAIADAATPEHKCDPDPRGWVDTYHARRTLRASEYDMFGPDVLICYHCGDERTSYECALIYAKAGPWYDSEACDYGEDKQQECRRLEIGEDSAVIVCKKHWQHEMDWRKKRNKDLEPSAQFDILPWPGN